MSHSADGIRYSDGASSGGVELRELSPGGAAGASISAPVSAPAPAGAGRPAPTDTPHQPAGDRPAAPAPAGEPPVSDDHDSGDEGSTSLLLRRGLNPAGVRGADPLTNPTRRGRRNRGHSCGWWALRIIGVACLGAIAGLYRSGEFGPGENNGGGVVVPTLAPMATGSVTPAFTGSPTSHGSSSITSSPIVTSSSPTSTKTNPSSITASATQTVTPTHTSTGTPTATNTPTHTSTKTPTATDTPTPTSTKTNTATNTPTHTSTGTPTATHTSTSTRTHTGTPTPTSTSIPVGVTGNFNQVTSGFNCIPLLPEGASLRGVLTALTRAVVSFASGGANGLFSYDDGSGANYCSTDGATCTYPETDDVATLQGYYADTNLCPTNPHNNEMVVHAVNASGSAVDITTTFNRQQKLSAAEAHHLRGAEVKFGT